jgi:two-component system, chemotaxis family, sensor kinase CheA
MTDTSNIGKAIKDFLAEAEEIIEQLGQELADLSDCADTGDCNPDLLNAIFRGAHSLKGLAGMFGFTTIQELAHNMENLLDSLRLGKIPLTGELVNVLYESLEILNSMIRHAGTGEDDHTDISTVVGLINACSVAKPAVVESNPLASLGLSAAMLGALTEYEEHRLLENVKRGRNMYSIHASFDLTTFDQDLAQLTDKLKKSGEVISTLPSVGGNIDTAIDFILLCGSELPLAEMSSLVEREGVSLKLLGECQPAAVSIPPPPLVQTPVPQSVATFAAAPPSVPAPPARSEDGGGGDPQTAKSMSRTVRVDIGKLDELMNIVGELVLCHSTINELASRFRQESNSNLVIELGKGSKVLERKLTELQKGVMEIRMIPVGQLYEKMGRIVRKISREQGKKLELKLYGADTELDKLIIEDISDPLMHIIRNSIDHGIELPAERVQAGKDERGIIKISSYQKGNHVVIEVEDDGRGINVEKVRRKALEKGLIQSSDALTEREVLDLIFLPGFSTADQVSEVSGRGVGMDVVKNNIAAVSGMVDVESYPGKGSKVVITLPITLAIIKALIINTVGRVYALPITSVLETILVERRDVLTVERKEVIQLREVTLPLLHLAKFFSLNGETELPESFYVVVVGAAEKRLGIVVNDLLGQQDIVIKSLGETFKGYRGISGAADLGDQRTILVLDVGGIISEATRGSA